ncbi:N-acetyltransferase family protein (plasmid) [Legionella sp. D16C41]|uniref:GNAT family N-acetyltransferase n=1 Tax=Legionella sp. D16C41 TaxID=3402688 RepID=UPI003AF5FCE0
MNIDLMPITRFANLKDVEAIANVHICSWQAMYKEFIPEIVLQALSITERMQQWHDLIKQGVQVLIAEVDNKIIGFASICAFRDKMAEPLNGEISAIYLHPNYWRKGLGTKLCLAALGQLANLGYRVVYLWVLADNKQARQFYEFLGFELTSLTKMEEFYEGGALLQEVLYKKIL